MATSAPPKHLPHGPIVQLGEHLWSVEGELPNMALRRRMTVIRREDGSLVVHSAILLSAEGMAEIDALGPVRCVLIPNGLHRIDAGAYHRRYPEATVLCPIGSAKRVRKAVADIGDYADFAADARVSLNLLEGVKRREGVVRVQGDDGVTLIFNDALFNVVSGGLMLKIMGSTGGPKVTRIGKMFLVADKRALRAHFERLAAEEKLVRLIPGHGEVIDEDAPGVLRRVAAAL